MPGMGFKVIDGPGYDDGGVADLSLLIDLEDSVQRRKRGDAEYFTALHKNLLPRATRGPMSRLSRRDQKVSLAQLLFSEDEDLTNTNGSDVFTGISPNKEDKVEYQEARERLAQARVALRMSMLLREPACCALSLCELCKRRLVLEGKDGGEAALRCAMRALEISGDGFYDSDEVALEVRNKLRCEVLCCVTSLCRFCTPPSVRSGKNIGLFACFVAATGFSPLLLSFSRSLDWWWLDQCGLSPTKLSKMTLS